MALAQFAQQVDRLVDQLRSMPVSRLARRSENEPSIADSSHALAQVLADLAADVEGVPRRDLPRLNDLASGDQVAVTANDLLEAVGIFGAPDGVVEIGLAAVSAVRERL